jgi:hypothetical protein
VRENINVGMKKIIEKNTKNILSRNNNKKYG